ncbi:unnamed protein product [Leptidea sinapis]|uniref:Gustatory receptor n=1 Tax=Leptidea sinapis TaxID=189913 RepID=A0A5E4QKA0_9NEOP|nr:unnamed protein product [Leptidea sinapis]
MNRTSFVRKLKQFLTLENFMNIQLLFGFYRKLHSTKWNTLGHFYCIAYFISVSSIAVHCLIYVVNQYNKIPMILHLLMFIVFKFFSLLTKRQYLVTYVSRLKSFDKIVKYKYVNFDPYFSFGIYFLLIFFPLTDEVVFCVPYINLLTAIALLLLRTSNILTIAPSVLIFNLFWNRMKFIRYQFGTINENHFTTDEKCRTIKKFILVYKYLLDNFRQVNNHIKFTMMIHNMEDSSTRYESNDGLHKHFNWIHNCFNFFLLLNKNTSVYFVSISSTAVYFIIYVADTFNKIPMILRLVNFIVFKFFSLTKRQYLLIYVSRLKSFDKIVNYKYVNFDPYLSFGIYFLLIFIALTDEFLFCISYINVFTAIPLGLLRLSNILTITPSVLIFNLFWNRMKFIRCKLRKINENHFTTDEKCSTIKKFILVYKYLLDNFRQVNNHIKFTMMIHEGKQLLCFIKNALFILFITSLIPIFQELILNEYDEIKKILAMGLMNYNETAQRTLLYDAIQYLLIRPPRYTIWRILPLDMSLMTGFTNISIGYIIVLISFYY